MKLRKYCFLLLFGLLAVSAGHAHDLPSCVSTQIPQEEVGEGTQNLPFHYEQINLLSMQQAFQQSHWHFQSVLFSENKFDTYVSRWEDLSFTFLQDIRFLLEIQLYPFHGFW